MEIYLIQHGLALSKEENAERSLSDQGRQTTTQMAEYLAARAAGLVEPPILEIRHSGKRRAQQTAEIFAHALGSNIPLSVGENMNPKDNPRLCYKELKKIREQTGTVILVGHLPHLSRLAGLLLTGDDEKQPIQFVNSGVLKIKYTDSGWAVDGYLTPACVTPTFVPQ